MGTAAKSLNPLLLFSNRLLTGYHYCCLRISFRAQNYCHYSTATSNTTTPDEENVESPTQFLKSLREQCRSRNIRNLDSAIKFFDRMGKIIEAVKLVDEMENKSYKPNAVTYGTIINALCKSGETSVAVGLLRKMEQANFELNVVLYNTIIDSLCKDRLLTEALDLSSKMICKGIHPDLVTYNSLIQGLCNDGRWKVIFFNQFYSGTPIVYSRLFFLY
ncbi:hypothetical protein CJ030_MR2G016365 [Morella rubra]|uniref:Uncharacterized protein n=1 Tax=Morella rubra TaxID=262757 RepID=A0A6A1WJ39_9ROSI|nr:hypothetical protein CJ030_MR2G016365 [Morella rubra]